ncbi:MAG: hypothetical protein WCW26_04555 [Candidatus Buchananbacteria bacterium]
MKAVTLMLLVVGCLSAFAASDPAEVINRLKDGWSWQNKFKMELTTQSQFLAQGVSKDAFTRTVSICRLGENLNLKTIVTQSGKTPNSWPEQMLFGQPGCEDYFFAKRGEDGMLLVFQQDGRAEAIRSLGDPRNGGVLFGRFIFFARKSLVEMLGQGNPKVSVVDGQEVVCTHIDEGDVEAWFANDCLTRCVLTKVAGRDKLCDGKIMTGVGIGQVLEKDVTEKSIMYVLSDLKYEEVGGFNLPVEARYEEKSELSDGSVATVAYTIQVQQANLNPTFDSSSFCLDIANGTAVGYVTPDVNGIDGRAIIDGFCWQDGKIIPAGTEKLVDAITDELNKPKEPPAQPTANLADSKPAVRVKKEPPLVRVRIGLVLALIGAACALAVFWPKRKK